MKKLSMAEMLFSSNPISYRMDRKSRAAVKLREEVNKKLFEFLGNYTDDVLAEYIVVLVCNGKHQIQARDDLEDFLGDDSKKFVTWLWDHLATENYISNTHLDSSNLKAEWTSSHEDVSNKDNTSMSLPDFHTHSTRTSSIPLVKVGRNNPSYCPTEADKERSQEPMLADNDSRASYQNALTNQFSSTKRCSSDNPSVDGHKYQNQKISRSNATLHQSPPLLRADQAAREITSVVKDDHQPRPLDSKNSSDDRTHSTVIDSAMHNIARKRGNVWDRLGKPLNEDHDDESRVITNSHEREELRNPRSMLIKHDNEWDKDLVGQAQVNKFNKSVHTSNNNLHLNNAKRKRLNIESNSGNNYASFSGCKEIQIVEKVEQNRHADRANPVQNSQTDKVAQYMMIKGASVATQAKGVINRNQPPSKPELDNANHRPVKDEVEDIKSKLRQMETDMLKLRSKQADGRNEAKPDAATGLQNHSEVDIESRTVLVTNVHFAASREALLSHFSKCGPVAKVVMLTDTITAQPKGAAYIIFAGIDSVEKAVSMSKSSFFSRILTVMRKAEVPPDFLVPSQSPAKLMQPQHFNQSQHSWKSSSTASAQRNYYASPHLKWRRDNNLAANSEHTFSATTTNVLVKSCTTAE